MTRDVVVLKIFSTELDAGMAKENLESAGIPAFIMKDDAGGMLPSMQATEGVKLIVAKKDAEEAAKILESMTDKND